MDERDPFSFHPLVIISVKYNILIPCTSFGIRVCEMNIIILYFYPIKKTTKRSTRVTQTFVSRISVPCTYNNKHTFVLSLISILYHIFIRTPCTKSSLEKYSWTVGKYFSIYNHYKRIINNINFYNYKYKFNGIYNYIFLKFG